MTFTSLTGSRVLLRPFGPDDITTAYISWLNDLEVVQYSNQRFITHDRASCENYLRSFDANDNLFLSIRLIADDRAIGTMTAYRNRHHNTADVGIMIGDRSIWGSGLGLEAWQLLTDWLLTKGGARKVTAGTLACNNGMLRLTERSGMVPDGARTAQEIVDGQPQDILYFARFAL